MKFAILSAPFRVPMRYLNAVLVRTRIVVLALIPVAGFLANATSYLAGESDVAAAFRSHQKSNELANASREFKASLSTIRIMVKDFSAKPSTAGVGAFARAHEIALQHLDAVAEDVDPRFAPTLTSLRGDVMELRKNFNELVRHQLILGFDDDSGLRQQLRNASNGIERIVNVNLSWLADAEAKRLMILLLMMRHYETEYRLTQSDLTFQQFHNVYKDFTETFAQVDGTAGDEELARRASARVCGDVQAMG